MAYKQFWHGDLLLKGIDKVPKEAKKINTRVLALGEATNHAHRLDGGKVTIYEVEDHWQRNRIPMMFVEIIAPATLVHVDIITEEMADHAPVEIPIGIYQVIRQIEEDPWEKRSRMVLD